MKKITIYQGDEYRAKIEKNFLEDDIFAEVYPYAYKIVDEIITEMDKYRKEHQDGSKSFTRYQGMGKNIVIFCGMRGQGKTSAMQTFLRCLNGTYLRQKKDKGLQIPAFVENIPQGRFEVLDSIDPSAMENNESVLRVLLSRLFFHLNELYKQNRNNAYATDDKQWPDVIRLFQKCFDNIDYIKEGKDRNDSCGQDDLEILSQMGSSANLKNNLRDLVDYYLQLSGNASNAASGSETGSGARYLVIPIDDADLATKKVFQLCEDLRNYLSIPNVIILMAANYDQLVSAAYQKYLKQNKTLRQAAISNYDKRQMQKSCYQMAAKYLEKLLPIGHRIHLPQIGNLITENHENLLFVYKVQNKNAFEKELCGCANLQKQLARLVYIRTGIILVDDDDTFHHFLPASFRELTHFVKMFYDMNEIDWRLLFPETDFAAIPFPDFEKQIDGLQSNLSQLKQYFIHYWCAKNLSASEMDIIEKIDDASQKHQMEKVHRILRKHLDKDASGHCQTYRDVMYLIAEKSRRPHSLLREALLLYYTIFLNEWFAAAMGQTKQFAKLADFVERTFDYPKDLPEHTYAFHSFDIKTDYLRKILEKDIQEDEYACLDNFFTAAFNGSLKKFSDVFRKADGKTNWDAEAQIQFDVLRPFVTVLVNAAEYIPGQPENEDALSAEDKPDHAVWTGIPFLLTAKNIIANYDVQIRMKKLFHNWYDKVQVKKADRLSWTESCWELYVSIDIMLKHCTGRHGEAEDVFMDTAFANQDLLNKLFLGNLANRGSCMRYLKDTLNQCLRIIRGLHMQTNILKEEADLEQLKDTYERQISSIMQSNPLDGSITMNAVDNNPFESFELLKKLRECRKAMSEDEQTELNEIESLVQQYDIERCELNGS